MFHRIGILVTTRARLVLAVGLLAVLAAGYLGVTAFGKLQTEGFADPESESSRAATALADEFGGAADYLFVVSPESGTVDDGAAAAAGRELTEQLRADGRLEVLASYFETDAPSMRSTDGRHALITASAVDDETEPADILDAYEGETDGATVRIGGAEATGEQVGAQIGADLGLAESIAIPLILILLVLAFGNVVGALVTLSVGIIAILGTFAELSLLGSVTDVSIYAVNLTTGLGLGLAVDYGLLMVARVREERTRRDHAAAVVRAVETAGRTIVFSATTVALALTALLVFPQYFLRSFAYAGVGVMLITAFSATVLLPAALTLLGDRIDKLRVPGVRGIRGEEAPTWARLARFVTRRPVLTAVPVLGVLALMAVPLLGISFGTPDDRVLPTSASSRQVGDLLREDFAADGSSSIDVVTTDRVSDETLASYAVELSRLPDVARVDTRLGSFTDGASTDAGPPPAPEPPGVTAERVAVVSDLDTRSTEARDLVESVRDVPDPGGTEALVGGPTAELRDNMGAIGDRLPIAVGWMVITTFVVLFLFTGSVVQPLRALVLNGIGLSATLGAMVWVFQDGHLSGLLGFTPLPMDTSMMVLLFCVAFGLSMDYEVFVLARIKEMRDSGLDNVEAVVHGLAHTGRIVSTAAALIAISFFAFLVSDVSFIQFFGLGTGLAILIDATLIRGVLLPAGIRLLGEAAWWAPRPLRALHRRVGVADSVPDRVPERV
ncbi:MMPL family transporter [Nocardioides bizhenqiangii]|uniref:MMPL family transporter n=1 Tax=Nocardioides bizhenqiangii TaxID=3095076 RepID=A0ABZ0ZUB9_9ACTN|nr:MMPL family transporter [Nocardioides sp. HM61]WQQ27895.1 MMPL family transporter [Nocardioides sp. HM61]